MEIKEVVYLFSDGTLNDFAALLVKDFKIATILIGGPIIWLLKRWVKFTPWTTDDRVTEIVDEKLGISR